MSSIAIIDYGMGNLRSVQKAIEKMGGNAIITNSPLKIMTATAVILPGVGAFQDAITQLKKLQLDVIIRRVIESGKPFLGICLGMHLLFSKSYEHGEFEGLDIIPGEVVKFPDTLKVPHIGWNTIQKSEVRSQKSEVRSQESEDRGQIDNTFRYSVLGIRCSEKIRNPKSEIRKPNKIEDRSQKTEDREERKEVPLLEDIADNSYFYFVHSYYVKPEDESIIATTTTYGLEFASMISKENVYATQFHPEKSQTLGLKIIQNFLRQME